MGAEEFGVPAALRPSTSAAALPSMRSASPAPSARRTRTNTGVTSRHQPRAQREEVLNKSASTPALGHTRRDFPSPQKRRELALHVTSSITGDHAELSCESVDKSAGFAARAVPAKLRRHQAATWDARVVPSAQHWQTESQRSLAGVLAPDVVEREASQRVRAVAARRKRLCAKAREKLRHVATRQYGSVHAMFEAFDTDVSGAISLEEFSTAFKRRGLEALFPREQQRVLFESIDRNYSESVDVRELMTFIEKTEDKGETQRKKGLQKGHPSGGEGNSERELRRLPPSVRATKDKILDAVYHKARAGKIYLDGPREHEDFLIKTFKQYDAEMVGALSPQEIADSLGPGKLNLGVSGDEILELIAHAQGRVGCCDDDGRVSYKNFVRFLDMTEIEPDFNPFFDHRNRELLIRKKMTEQPWRADDEDDAAEEPARFAVSSSSGAPPFLAPRRRARTALPANSSAGYIRPLVTSEQMRDFNATIMTQHRASASGPLLPMRPATVGGDVFDQMLRTKRQELSTIGPRFSQPPPTDWARTGCGGDGVDSSSALFLSQSDRFNTTSSSYFTPFTYVPNHPVARETECDAGREARARRDATDQRQLRTRRHKQTMADHHKALDRRAIVNDRQKLKQKATEMLTYFQTTYEKDLTSVGKSSPESMQRRPHDDLHERMWGGNKSNMLHGSNSQGAVFDATTSSQMVGQHARNQKQNRTTNFGPTF